MLLIASFNYFDMNLWDEKDGNFLLSEADNVAFLKKNTENLKRELKALSVALLTSF